MAKSTKSGSSYKFYNMGSKGLKYDVMCGKGVAIPAGTKRDSLKNATASGFEVVARSAHSSVW